jgi:phage shock protein PspC (stress-responsive transcriptional regulator)
MVSYEHGARRRSSDDANRHSRRDPGNPFRALDHAAGGGMIRERLRVPLHRSRKHRMIAGVCGGIAEWLGWDPTIVRVLYILVSIVSIAFPGILVYLILWLVIPQAPPEI